jgi:tRNA-2-methylthio-N6-dimethylallyladenosine synthase
MNEADSSRVADELDKRGYSPATDPEHAEVIVLNSCVVRQSAEDRVVGRLWSLKPVKESDPNRIIALMGCMVGVRPNRSLTERFPSWMSSCLHLIRLLLGYLDSRRSK